MAASTPFSSARRSALLALTLPLAPGVLAGPALPASVRIAAVARSAPGGKTAFSGVTTEVIGERWLESELAKLGVRLDWVPVTTNSVAVQVNEGFAAKSIDFAGYGDLPSIIAHASGLRTKLVVPGGSQNNTYLVVPAASSATSIRELKGKRIALHRGRPWEYQFAQLLKANRMSFADVKIVNLNPQAGAAAVSTGSVDAFFTLSDAFILEDKKVARIAWSSKNPPESWKMRAELWGDSDFLERYPQAGAGGQEGNIKREAQAGQLESVVRRELAGDQTAWKQMKRASTISGCLHQIAGLRGFAAAFATAFSAGLALCAVPCFATGLAGVLGL